MNYKWIKDDVEYILLRPDTYIGGLNITSIQDRKFDNNKFIDYTYTLSNGLLHLFNEVISNSIDEYNRHKTVKNIIVSINTNINSISVQDDGNGIGVYKDKEHDIYIPEMLVSKLHSGSNFDDTEERNTIGRNGVGLKGVNIFSKMFKVQTCDGKKYFEMQFEQNSRIQYEPTIKNSKINHTKITFVPDLKRFNYETLPEDLIHYIRKKVIDLAGLFPNIRFILDIDNTKEVHQYKSIKQYYNLFVDKEEDLTYYEDDIWNIGITNENGKFSQISYVNGVQTEKGGKHVEKVCDIIIPLIKERIEKKYKVPINTYHIKQNIKLIVNSNIINPSYTTQNKIELDSEAPNLELSPKFINLLYSSNVFNVICEFAIQKQKEKEQQEIRKITSKLDKIKVEKLKDAKGKDRTKCQLFIVEGFSAQSGFLKYRDNQIHGIYVLQGKSLGNVHGMTEKAIYENKELSGLMSSLGLKIGKKADKLRYNEINIMTDSDNDGSAITSLLINFFNMYWPELFEQGKIYQILTPVVVAKLNKTVKEFYSELEYNNWIQSNTNEELRKWNISFKKGLAALKDDEYKKQIYNSKKIQFVKDDETDNILQIWFDKKDKDKKRQKLISETFCDGIIYKNSQRNISEYLKNEYLSFAYYTIQQRAIPSVIDGFKPVQRKIINESIRLWKDNKTELKCYQLGGYVAARQKYHHGDGSLNGAIINMVQQFKNNLSLFDEDGQYGDLRNRDAGAPRYIGTKLNSNFNLTYKDNNLLTSKYDEGQEIEPNYFLPIIPMVLVNGSSGIAVGFATNILNRSPKNIIDVCMDYLNGKNININKLKPFYNQFTNNNETKLLDEDLLKWGMYGKIEMINSNTVKISEIPPNYESESYEKILNNLVDKKIIVDYDDNCTDKIEYVIKFTKENLLKYSQEDLIKLFGLEYTENENLNTLDEFGKLKNFKSIHDLIKYFIDFRLTYYDKRKSLLITDLNYDIKILTNKINFLNGIINNKIKVHKISKQDIINQLIKMKFDTIDDNYNYLLNLSIYSLTKEYVEEYNTKLNKKQDELSNILNVEPKQMYIDDLSELKIKLSKK